MSDEWSPHSVAICVPVRNERVLLPALIGALAEQDRIAGRVSVCLLFDGCTDESEAVAAEAASRLPFALVTQRLAARPRPNAGRARRAALALGLRTVGRGEASALLTTDADTQPTRAWLAASCEALRAADVVAGRILRTDAPCRRQDRIETYYDALYGLRRRLDPVPWEAPAAHHHTGGASLAFRTAAYRALGGFAALPWGEDAAIIDAAHRAGLRIRRDPGVVVETSSRRIGRAVNGLADHLRHLDAAAEPMVAHPADAAWQYRGHAVARASFAQLDEAAIARVADYLCTDRGHVRRVAAMATNAEAFATHVVPGVPTGERLVPLAEAEQALVRLGTTLFECAA